MNQALVNALILIIVLGAGAQWIAWLLRLPAILLLLLTGFVAGPILGILEPDRIFGNLLLPLVSLFVALILFEGGLGLNFRELQGFGGVVRNLVTVGALLTGAVATLAAYWIIGLDLSLSCLLGATLSVTGPTVVLPLLEYVKPRGPVGPVLKWEGIVIDPIGALLAVAVFEAVLGGRLEHAPIELARALAGSTVAGGGLGLLAALLLVQVIRRHIVPDALQATVALGLVLGVFGLANLIQAESGLAATTVMGIALANQRSVDMRSLVEFKEHLRVMLLSSVFILLSARLRLADLQQVGPESVLFVAVLILVARPLCVVAATAGSTLNWRERLFLMWMAPRGIVAAAVASVFSLALEQAGYRQARLILPVTFATIVGTVVVYGLTVATVGRWLKVTERNPQGLLIVGAGRFAQRVAEAIQKSGFRVLLVDTNRAAVAEARAAGLNAYHGSILSEDVFEKADLAGIGRLLAMTPNDEVNLLAGERLARFFGRGAIYQLAPKTDMRGRALLELRAAMLFSDRATYQTLDDWVGDGAVVKATKITGSFDYQAFRERYGDQAISLFIEEKGRLQIVRADQPVAPRPGQTLWTLARSMPAVAAQTAAAQQEV